MRNPLIVLCVIATTLGVATGCRAVNPMEEVRQTFVQIVESDEPEESVEFTRHSSEGSTNSTDPDGTRRLIKEGGDQFNGPPSLIKEWIRAHSATPTPANAAAVSAAATTGLGGVSPDEMRKLLIEAGWEPPDSQPTTQSQSYATGVAIGASSASTPLYQPAYVGGYNSGNGGGTWTHRSAGVNLPRSRYGGYEIPSQSRRRR